MGDSGLATAVVNSSELLSLGSDAGVPAKKAQPDAPEESTDFTPNEVPAPDVANPVGTAPGTTNASPYAAETGESGLALTVCLPGMFITCHCCMFLSVQQSACEEAEAIQYGGALKMST